MSDVSETQTFQARMLNEFVYCPRLFYYECVEGVFVENADTLRGGSLHRCVDAGSGRMPTADTKTLSDQPAAEEEVVDSRSVQMGSARLGVSAKMDLVEVRSGGDATRRAVEVCPVDYKAGAPRAGTDGNELWDTDKMRLGLQVLILRENGYACREAVIYYRATKQRVRLVVSPELEAWIVDRVQAARRTPAGPIPPPLVSSPKCPRCSLVTVCLPDETRILAAAVEKEKAKTAGTPGKEVPRRLIAARDDCRALYLNQPGLRVGCRDELLQVKDEKVLDEVRINDVSHVALFGNIQISTQAIQRLCEAEVPVTYFSMGGWF